MLLQDETTTRVMPMKTILFLAIFCWAVTTKLSANQFLAGSDRPTKESFPISRLLDVTAERRLLVIGGGLQNGLIEGSTYTALRKALNSRNGQAMATWIETGRVRIVKVEESLSYAEIETEQGPFSAAFFPKYPKLMAGDWLTLDSVKIVKNIQASPNLSAAYDDLFVDPKAFPLSFELSEAGRAKLQDLATRIAHLRLTTLLIEGHTDSEGEAAVNQVESYQRALTIRQFLISELGFEAKRVVALGLGEAELLYSHNEPGHSESNRRIVIKARPF